MTEESTELLQPKPQRHYDLTPTSTNSSRPSSPSQHQSDSSRNEPESFDAKANRTRSILNLTSSTLFGIYTPSASGFETNRDEPSTPAGNGTQTPARTFFDAGRSPLKEASERLQPWRRESQQHHFEFQKSIGLILERVVLLFLFGVAYGVIVSHLHHSEQVTPVKIDLRGIERDSWGYLMGWGGVGVLLGGLLPWVDILWEEVLGNDIDVFASSYPPERPVSPTPGIEINDRPTSRTRNGLGADWNPVVRGIGAFIGIAFAIRKLPWQSTSQVSLTLALVNPVLWYLVDRSKPGFLLSALIGVAGTAIAFGINPEIVPSPAAPSLRASLRSNLSAEFGYSDSLISNESIGIGTWIASVLFCSSVCFGNIGRRLALGTEGRRLSAS